MSAPLHVVILAAGEGKRMKSSLPKVLQKIAGKPMLAHVIDCARALAPAGVHVVYGHRGEAVRSAFSDQNDLFWTEQAQQLGTGHALQQAMPNVPQDARVLVLYGDVPLITPATLQHLLAAPGRIAVLVADLDDPTGYGRVIRDAEGKVARIVEQKDANDEQLELQTVNTGIIVADGEPLRRWLEHLRNDNAQGEYYLTDVFAFAASEFDAAEMVHVVDPIETEGANDPWQLAQLERAFQKRAARTLCLQGARLVDPARIDIRGTVSVGMDVEIDADVVLEGEVKLADGVRIGPFCRLKDVTLGPGTEVRAHCDLDGVVVEGAAADRPVRAPAPGHRAGRRRACRQLRRNQERQARRVEQGQSPDLPRRRRDRQPRQHRRRHHHLQLRRREQVDDHHRGRRVHRLQLVAGRAGNGRQERHDRRRFGDQQERAGRPAHDRARQAGVDRRLAAAGEEAEEGRLASRAAQAGSTSDTHNPPPSRLDKAMRPPCASAISRASARPRPVPWRLVE